LELIRRRGLPKSGPSWGARGGSLSLKKPAKKKREKKKKTLDGRILGLGKALSLIPEWFGEKARFQGKK